ncbi:hypothetical protein [Methylobacterium sp. 190mf]|uniref:hypothetical protein n=1 Tax=Methylobacterium sp. 190mf TaxID=1761798 RepID=UPI0011B0B0E4|nr:hypothetical protein [Methylobacterium sp. 190mf]
MAASVRPTVLEWFAKFEVERGAEELRLARTIHDWWAAQGAKIGTTRSARPSLFAQIEYAGRVGYPASVKPSGRISTGLYAIKSLPPFDREDARRETVASLREITGMVTSDRSFDGEPTLPVLPLKDQAVRDQLFSV